MKETLETLGSLESVLGTDRSGIITIKPKVIFELVEKCYQPIPTFTLPIPSSIIGSVTTLEASLISSLIFLKRPQVIFEFGTFFGYTTSILLRNSSPNCKVFSIDLPKTAKSIGSASEKFNWDLIQSNDAYNDAYLTDLALKSGERYLLSSTDEDRLLLIKQDSMQFNPEEFGLIENTDLIFLDGGHTNDIVRSDTNNSLKMLSDDGILVWHDYGSKVHNKVTDVVDEYSKNNIVVQIKNTMLALTAKNFISLLSS